MTKHNNNVEIEAKFNVSNLNDINKKLEITGAILSQPRVYERNLRFDTPGGDLRREFKVLRLRQDTQNRLTFKAPKENNQGIHHRTEIEFSVSDFENTQYLLEALGYEIFMVYEKYRTSYTLGEVSISLDELPFGYFVEIEGPNSDTIRGIASILDLQWKYSINNSYSEIFEHLRQVLGFTFRDLTFDNFLEIKSPLNRLSITPADLTDNDLSQD